MMNIFIIIGILLANMVAIILTYHFIKTLDKKEKVIFIAVAVAINYIIVSIIYGLSSIGIEQTVSSAAKSFVTYMFVPVNMIIFMPVIANTYCNIKLKNIKREKVQKRIIIMGVIALIVIICEFFYFKNIQVNIANYNFIK